MRKNEISLEFMGKRELDRFPSPGAPDLEFDREDLLAALNGLSWREKQIIEHRYARALRGDCSNCEHTLAELGRKFKVTRARVWQIEQAGLRKMWQHLYKLKIKRK